MSTETDSNSQQETPNLQSTPSSPKGKVEFKKILAILMLTIFGLFLGVYLPGFPSRIKSYLQEQKNKELKVEQVQLGYQLSIFFNDHVEIEELRKHLKISPRIEGQFQAGGNQDYGFSYRLTPSSPLKFGTKFTIEIRRGMKSTNGKVLPNNFKKTITHLPSDLKDGFEFRKGEFNSRVLMFGSNTPVEFSALTGFSNLNVDIIKANKNDILKFLSYEEKIHNEGNSQYATQEYVGFVPTYKQNQIVKTQNISRKGFEVEMSLPVGAYFAVAKDSDKTLKAMLFFVNQTGILVRQDDKKIIASAYDITSSRPVTEPITLELYNAKDSPTLIKSAQLSTLTTIPQPFDDRVDYILGQRGDEMLLIPLKIPETLADIRAEYDLDKKQQLFLYTDRPIYKPGDTVNFRGMVRTDNDGLYQLPQSPTNVTVLLGDLTKPDFKVVVQPDANGIFKGQLIAPDISNSYGQDGSQSHYMYASTNTDRQTFYQSATTARFDVAQYKKPKFELTVTSDKDDILQHENPVFKAKGMYFEDKKPISNDDFTYTFYHQDFYEVEKSVYNENFNITSSSGMCGGGGFGDYLGQPLGKQDQSMTFDANGEAIIDYTAVKKKFDSSQQVTLVVKKTDSNGNKVSAAKTIIVHGASASIFFGNSTDFFYAGDMVQTPLLLESQAGEKLSNQSITYSFVDRDYGNDSKVTDKSITKGTVTTDSQGQAVISFPAPQNRINKNNYLVVSYKDQYGNVTSSTRYISITSKEAKSFNYRGVEETTRLKIVSPQKSFIVGNAINLKVTSPSNLTVLLSYERGRIYESKNIELTKGENTVSIPVDQRLSPSIALVFSFFERGNYYTEGLTLNVPAMHKLLSVEVKPSKETYAKDDTTATLTITTKDNKGSPVSANVSLAIIDKAIYALRKDAMTPIHSGFYYFRERSTNASSSLTSIMQYGGGGGGGGGGGESLSQLVDTLYWNPDLKTDANGSVEIQVPLSNFSTIWKAVAIASTDATDVGQHDADFATSSQ